MLKVFEVFHLPDDANLHISSTIAQKDKNNTIKVLIWRSFRIWFPSETLFSAQNSKNCIHISLSKNLRQRFGQNLKNKSI